MNILIALDMIADIEKSFAQLYKKLQADHSDSAQVSAFFGSLHLDEIAHMKMVDMEKKIIRQNADMRTAEISLNLSEIASTSDTIRYMMENLVELPEALEKIYLLESGAAELYVVSALQEVNSDMKQLLVGLSKTFRVHREEIEDFIRKQGISLEALENARLRRVRVPFSADIMLDGSYRAKASDINEGGMFIMTGRPLDVGSSVKLEFKISDLPVRAVGRVLFNYKNVGSGIAFLGLGEAERTLIRGYIQGVLTETVAEDKYNLLVINPGLQDRNISIIRNVLVQGGFKIIEVGTPSEAISVIEEKEKIRAVVMYLDSKDDAFFSFLPYIKNNPHLSVIPVVIVTSNYSVEFKDKLLQEKADMVLEKLKTTPKALLEKLEDLVRQGQDREI